MPYAEESVVVRNPRPMKAGNRLEEKTEGTQFQVIVGCSIQKILHHAKGRRQTKECKQRKRVKAQVKKTKAEMPRGTVKPGMTNLLTLEKPANWMKGTDNRSKTAKESMAKGRESCANGIVS